MILSRDELRELTGYRRRGHVITWLRRHGIPYRQRGTDGWPAVVEADLVARPQPDRPIGAAEPRFD